VSPIINKLAKEFKSAQYQKKTTVEEIHDAPSLDDVPVINLDEEEGTTEDLPF
jgi:hypothetical protein